jgi:hypothetical protein
MVALEEGLFCDNRDPRRLQLARNNLSHGLHLGDGSVFKYSLKDGPTIMMDTNQQRKPVECLDNHSTK